MDSKNCSSGDDGTDKVSDDMLLYLAKHYLKEQDCLALAISGSSYNFPSLYAANRKRLAIGRCFFLTPTSWTRFFKGYISPHSIITFDASHTYWLPAEVLVESTVQMINLEELLVDDTKVSLSHFPKIFEACQKVLKLSFTLNEKSLNEKLIAKPSLDLLKRGFAKLTHLKMFNFTTVEEGNSRYIHENGKTIDVEHPYESWLRILQVLKWCRDCIDLVIYLAYPEKDDYFGKPFECEKIFGLTEAELLPLLDWMKNLKSLAILRNNRSKNGLKGMQFFWRLFGWLSSLFSKSGTFPEQFWITNYDCPLCDSFTYSTPSSVFGSYMHNLADLEQIADEDRGPFSVHPNPNLKYLRGYCRNTDKALNDLCRTYPKLEQIYFYAISIREEIFGEGDWSLHLLKILVYHCDLPSKKFIQQVIKGCPNIEELTIDLKFHGAPMEIDFFSEFRLKHLRHLSINGFYIDVILSNGSYLPQICKHCPKLESLHLKGVLGAPFFDNLTMCLPSAANLRDLRLEWLYGSFNDNCEFPSLLNLMKALTFNSSNLPYFERLVLKSGRENKGHSVDFAEVVEFIVPFAKGMTHLVALGLIGFPFQPDVAEEIRRRLAEEIVPGREAFWFHLGDQPEENDTSVPRIHNDEIVAPRDAFFAPPKF